jgi:hypothetical protein
MAAMPPGAVIAEVVLSRHRAVNAGPSLRLHKRQHHPVGVCYNPPHLAALPPSDLVGAHLACRCDQIDFLKQQLLSNGANPSLVWSGDAAMEGLEQGVNAYLYFLVLNTVRDPRMHSATVTGLDMAHPLLKAANQEGGVVTVEG